MLKISSRTPVTRFDTARTLLGGGWYWSTAYLVDGLLIDSGCSHASRQLVASLRGKEPHTLVNTHAHEDHIGANGLLQQHCPALRLLAHPLALPILQDPRHRQPLQLYRRTLWGYPAPSVAQPLQDGDWVETPGHRFQVLYTPGHSLDSLSLYEPERGWLFTGDLFVGGHDRALGRDYDIGGIIASLKKIAGLHLTAMFPGSARLRENPGQELAEKITYLEDLGGRVRQLHARGWNLSAITRLVCGPPLLIELVTWGHFSRRNLVASFLEFPH